MICPIDSTQLVMSERQGIEIDYCPSCRGVWLDRGELDKIIERSETSPQQPAPSRIQEREYSEPRYNTHHTPKHHPQEYHRKKRKESFLGDLFDF